MTLRRILVLASLFFVLSQAAVLSFYDFSQLHFCWDARCLARAANIFQIPLKLATTEVYIFSFIVAAAALSQQTRSANAVNFAAHYDYVDKLLTKQVGQLEYLRDVEIASPLLHASCFPHYAVSIKNLLHTRYVEQWKCHVSQFAERCRSGGTTPAEWREHQCEVEHLMRSVGIFVHDIELQMFLLVEADCYRLFQLLSAIGGHCDFGEPPDYLPKA